MINEVTVTYNDNGIDVSLSANLDYDTVRNPPYRLADLFSRVIKDTMVNPNMVIEQLSNEFDYKAESEEV